MYSAIGQTAPTLFNMHIGYITLTLKTQAHLHWLELFQAQSKPAAFSATANQDSTKNIKEILRQVESSLKKSKQKMIKLS